MVAAQSVKIRMIPLKVPLEKVNSLQVVYIYIYIFFFFLFFLSEDRLIVLAWWVFDFFFL
jgi:hypothetical protein